MSARKWWLTRRAKGLCVSCDNKSKAWRCPECNAKFRDAARMRYREKHGIPVDAPITRGRIRKT